jgi:Protein tyrosine and serine/threonine kinase
MHFLLLHSHSPDLAVPGLALISAIAPFYYTGNFLGYEYEDTYIGTVGVDIAVNAVSAFLDVLQDSLTPMSFGLLVDANFNAIVISQEAVNRIYPERTGMEPERVTYNLNDGSIVHDRRNQTYLPSDTILQDLTKLQSADWGGLLEEVRQVTPGDRKYTTLNITVTGDLSPTQFYVMFERWQYVADWTLLVFAPIAEVQSAINVYTTTTSHDNSTAASVMEGEQGTLLRGSGMLVNRGNLDVEFSVKTLPDWVMLETPLFYEKIYHLRAGEELTIDFQVDSGKLTTGTQSAAIVFNVQDDEYPDCFFSQDLSIPLTVTVIEKTCPKPSQVADANGVCACDSSSIEISGSCVDIITLVVIIVVPVLVLALLALCINGVRKRRMADSEWIIKPSELKYDDDKPQVIGEGSFGRVFLAEYRTTQVAVKCIRPSTSFKGKKHSRAATRNGINATSDADSMESGSARSPVPEQSPQRRKSTAESGSWFGQARKKMSCWNGVSSKQEFTKEMLLLSKLRHPCVTQVMGAVISKQTGPMLVMEYMQNGSLYDVLHNITMELDGELILSIMKDVSSGLRFLHNTQPPLVHGNLKSHNILVSGCTVCGCCRMKSSNETNLSLSFFRWTANSGPRFPTLVLPTNVPRTLGCIGRLPRCCNNIHP